MIIRVLINVLVVILFALVQTSFISGLSSSLGGLQLAILLSLFFLAIDKKSLAFIYAFAIGLVMSFFSMAPFGLYALAFLLAVIVVDLVFENIITNRSLYSFIMLSVVANVSYKIFLYSFWMIISWLNYDLVPFVLDTNFWIFEIKILLVNMITMIVVYQALSYISKKYQPRFLVGFNRYG